MDGTITQITADRGTGSVLGEDGKLYAFRRAALRDCWFHELGVGAAVTFDVGRAFEAVAIRLVRPA
jgi:hypothetical protein